MRNVVLGGLLSLLVLTACPSREEKAKLPAEGQNTAALSATNTENKQDAPLEAAPPSAEPANATIATAASSQPATVVTPQAAATKAETDNLRVSGSVTSNKQGSASFKVAGHIAKIAVKVGDRVRRGQVLASLDDTDYALRVRMASNALEQAKIASEQAKKDMRREEQLRRENATTVASYERMANAVANAQIAEQQAALNLQQARNALADTRLLATYDGVISKKFKTEGEHVGVGVPVFEVFGTTEVEISVRVPESLLRKVKVGQRVPLSVPSLGQEMSMKITRVVPVVQDASRTFEVIGAIEGSAERLFPGQFVEAQL